MADDLAELTLGDEQAGANPAFDMVAGAPALWKSIVGSV